MLSKITVAPAPHVSKPHSTRTIMLDVIIALVPAAVAAIIFFRERAIILIAATVLSCMAAEWLCNLIRKKPNSLDDLSAVVTGLILAFSLSPAVPWWMAVIGGFFSIVIAKMLFGGLGANIFNPAMAARAFLAASFGMMMSNTWVAPAAFETEAAPAAQTAQEEIDVTTTATPLALVKQYMKGETEIEDFQPIIRRAFIGNITGCLGETSALALFIGGFYLVVRKTINVHIPIAVIVSAAVIAEAAFLINPDAYAPASMHIFGGSIMLCAFFIATDPVTAPLSVKGMWVFGIGVGALIMLIRIFGGYPEGVMYAVLIMNAFTPLIDRMFKLTPSGGLANAK